MIKKVVSVFVVLAIAVAGVSADQLSRERQIEIIQNYLMATGQTEGLESLAIGTGEIPTREVPIKCGTPAIMDFVFNRDKFDPDLAKILSELIVPRPTNLNLTVPSPSGRFLIHYTDNGSDAVYDGFPGYADSVAKIYDEVYAFLVDTLGYPDPPTDDFYPEGGSAAFDVYLQDLGGMYFGLTYLDYYPIDAQHPTSATAFQILDNDYQEIPPYVSNPLMAVRVTCAHEFFHVVQFGIDFTEGSQSPDGFWRSYWMEMTATYMEEEKYDHINDYYFYLPYFFDSAAVSIERFTGSSDLHPYASMLYPLFLAERHDRDLIRDIWIRCGQLGAYQDNLLEAADEVIGTFTSGQESFASSFHEFTLWNYFTGSRASWAPPSYGYEERAEYDEFRDSGIDSIIAVYRNFTDSIIVDGADNPYNPYHNAAFYLKLDDIQNLQPDTTYWLCLDGSFPACLDSIQVLDPNDPYDIMHIDSVFSVGFDLDQDFPYAWGLNIVYENYGSPGSDVEELTLPANFGDLIDFYLSDLEPYASMSFILTPASDDNTLFEYVNGEFDIGYQIATDLAIVDSSLISLPGAMLAPYPNPAVVSELGDAGVRFKFQVPTDDESFPIYPDSSSVSLYVDIFTVAGEYIRTLELLDFDLGGERMGQYWTEWDLKNGAGDPVASGVYIAYGRLFGDSEHRQIIAEGRTKVLVIR